MADHHITPGKTALYLVCLAGIVAGLALWAAPGGPDRVPARATEVLPDTLAFEVRYGGIAAEGGNMLWQAETDGPMAGLVTIRMEYAGDPADRRMPTWPVNVGLIFSADDLRGSFAAELSGTMSWRTGEMRVAGLVSDGARRDAAVEQRMRVMRPGLDGNATLVFYPRIAWAGARE
jgi:hypothetical protein